MKLRKLILPVLSILMTVALAFAGLVGSEAGSRWLLRQAISSLPGSASVRSIEGRLIDSVVLSGIHFQSGSASIGIERLALDWNAGKLLMGILDIADFNIQGVDVRLSEDRQQEPSAPFELPTDISLPVELILKNFLITDLKLVVENQEYRLRTLYLSAGTENGRLGLTKLELDAEPIVLAAHGQIGLAHGYPLMLNIDWGRLRWPMAGVAQLQSEQGTLSITGRLNDYRMALAAELTRPDLPKAHLNINGKGSLDDVSIDRLEVESEAGSLRLTGEASWRDALFFDVAALGNHFDPGIVWSEIPGSLTFKTHIRGSYANDVLMLDARLDRLSGTLRGYLVEADGTMRLSGDQLKIDALKIASGSNRLAADGILEPQKSRFEVAIDAPGLNQIWPGLSGSLKAKGEMRGAWTNPAVKFQAKGKRLRFQEHQAEQLAIDIDYGPEPEKVSTMSLSASVVKSGAVALSGMLLQGKGSLENHFFKADIRSPYGDLSSEINGRLKQKSWLGSFSELDLQSRDFGRWRLEKKMEIGIQSTDSGIGANVGKTCLIRQQASVCLEGEYLGNGDFKAGLKAVNLPVSLIGSRLPEKMSAEGLINGDAEIKRKKIMLSGQYRFDLPDGVTLHIKNGGEERTIALGASSASGKIQGETITADLDLALQARDFVRSRLKMNIGKSRAISGQLSASMAEFGWLKPFVPGLTEIRGALKADLALSGTVARPQARGFVKFSDGAVQFKEYRIDPVELEAVAGDKNDRIRIQGAAGSGEALVRLDGFYYFNGDYQFAFAAPVVPLALLQPYLPENTEVAGSIRADADIRQQNGVMRGRYRIDMPPGTKVNLASPEPAAVSLGASQLSGQIDGNIVSAELELGLAGKDSVRGRLRMDAGGDQSLDGQVSASISELSLLGSVVPQLSGVRGQIHADIRVHGTVAEPLAQGTVELSRAAADVDALGLKLREINLKAFSRENDGRRLLIEGGAKSGKGILTLDGHALLQKGWPVDVQINGENFEVVKLPEAEIAVSPRLKLEADRAAGNLAGLIKVDLANIELTDLPENSVKVSGDEIILGEEKAQAEASIPFHLNADIEVDLGKNIRFSGLGLKTQLAGKLRIAKTGEQMALHGNVDMKEARYKSYGQDLTVRKGRFLFNGPAENPWLEVEAIRLSKNRKVTAILGVSGPAKAPVTKISSEPALPETEALAYLITGEPLTRASKSEGEMIAGAALSYGIGKASWLADKLGLDEFDVREGEKLQDTMVAVGEYLNPDFYVGAKLGLFNKQASLVLKHKLTERLGVESETGESQRVKLNYEFDAD